MIDKRNLNSQALPMGTNKVIIPQIRLKNSDCIEPDENTKIWYSKFEDCGFTQEMFDALKANPYGDKSGFDINWTIPVHVLIENDNMNESALYVHDTEVQFMVDTMKSIYKIQDHNTSCYSKIEEGYYSFNTGIIIPKDCSDEEFQELLDNWSDITELLPNISKGSLLLLYKLLLN